MIRKINHVPAGIGLAGLTDRRSGESISPANDRSIKGGKAIILGVLFAIVPVLFVLYTHQVWEDFLITFRHSENLVRGHGLVYYPGQKVQGFTSPIGVLLPALFYWMTGAGDSYLQALWIFRVLSAIAFGVAGVLFLRRVYLPGRGGKAIAIFAILLFVLDAKGVAFSGNGQETAFMLLLVAWGSLFLDLDISRCWRWLGVVGAGLEWTRPDGFVFAGALAAGMFFFGSMPRKKMLGNLLKALAVGLILYSPWLIATWIYYGSPIPETIIAKAAISTRFTHGISLGDGISHFLYRLPLNAPKIFLPVYPGVNDWPLAVRIVGNVLPIYCGLYWLLPRGEGVGRGASFAFFLICIYFMTMETFFPWYAPPAALLGMIVLTRSGGKMLASSGQPIAIPLGVLACCLLVERGYVFFQSARIFNVQQRVIEEGVRKQIGLYIKANGKRTDTVMLEPFGYIGYYSDAHICDWPGLVCPEMARLVRDPKIVNGGDVEAVIRPDWIVLRPVELEFFADNDYFRTHYDPVIAADAAPQLEPYSNLPGQGYLRYDARFLIYHVRQTK